MHGANRCTYTNSTTNGLANNCQGISDARIVIRETLFWEIARRTAATRNDIEQLYLLRVHALVLRLQVVAILDVNSRIDTFIEVEEVKCRSCRVATSVGTCLPCRCPDNAALISTLSHSYNTCLVTKGITYRTPLQNRAIDTTYGCTSLGSFHCDEVTVVPSRHDATLSAAIAKCIALVFRACFLSPYTSTAFTSRLIDCSVHATVRLSPGRCFTSRGVVRVQWFYARAVPSNKCISGRRFRAALTYPT